MSTTYVGQRRMSLFISRLLLSFAALLPFGPINAPSGAGAAPQPDMEAWLHRQPLTFFVAKDPSMISAT